MEPPLTLTRICTRAGSCQRVKAVQDGSICLFGAPKTCESIWRSEALCVILYFFSHSCYSFKVRRQHAKSWRYLLLLMAISKARYILKPLSRSLIFQVVE